MKYLALITTIAMFSVMVTLPYVAAWIILTVFVMLFMATLCAVNPRDEQ